MRAVVMAGGEGTRLRPLTSNQPKPMVPICNRPIMEYILELVRGHDMREVVVTLQFLPTLIRNYFGDGADWGLDLSYMVEEKPLGTAGGVKNASAFLDDTFLVISGDALTDIDLSAVAAFHRERRAMVTIAMVRVANPLEFGIVVTDAEGRIERFLEKPNWGQVFSDTINTGIYILEPSIFEYIPEGPFDFSHDLFPLLLEKGFPVYGYVAEGYWCDVGNFEQYARAHKDIMDGKTRMRPPGFDVGGGIWLGEGCDIAPGANIKGPAVLGDHCRLEDGCTVREYSVLGNNVVLKEGGFVHRTLINDNTYVGNGSHLRGCIVGKNCDIKANVRLEEGVVIGHDCKIGENVVVNHDVKIYPFKTVDAGATVNSSIIWESKGLRSLFGKRSVSGIMNIDITPEHAIRIAMAYGSALPRNSYVVVSRDQTRAARTIKRAVIAGLNAAGVNIYDLEVAPLPVNRFTIRAQRASGGVDIRLSAFDPQSIEIYFFDEEGIDINGGMQRNIEKFFYQANFRRAFQNEIGAIAYPPHALEHYVAGLLGQVDEELVRSANFKLVVDYAYGGSAAILPAIFSKLGCEVMGLNAWPDETRATLTLEEVQSSRNRLSELVKASRADMGILLDNSGERIYLVDGSGRQLSMQTALLLLISLVCRSGEPGRIAVPVTVSSAVDEIAGRYGCEVLRTKVSRNALMEAAMEPDIVFAGAAAGGYIFPRFLPSYDAMVTLAELLEALAKQGRSLAQEADDLPPVYLATGEVASSWENKGLIMRRLVEMEGGHRLEMIDGVKLYLDGDAWVLVLPDPDEPLLHLLAEAGDDSRASEILANFTGSIKELMRG
ncbi:MAG: sugar phosphate nucleotidyltransferase [Candidatus Geothermincolia bacterium]